MPGRFSVPADEMFRIVFRSLHFPYLSADLERLLKALDHSTEGSHCWIELAENRERRPGHIGALRGILSRLDVPPAAAAALLSAPAISSRWSPEEAVPRLTVSEECRFVVAEREDRLIWEEESVWPAAYSNFLGQLNGLILTFEALMKVRRQEVLGAASAAGFAEDNSLFLDHFTRVMPTELHYAAASLGAWLGGADNVQFFAHYASAPQLQDEEYAVKMARLMGYSEAEAGDLAAGGIVALPPQLAIPLIETQGRSEVFGGIAVNEISMANPAEMENWDTGELDISQQRPGLILDSHYRAPFLGRPLDATGLYGTKDVLRDHYSEFYESHPGAENVRCKHYVAPILDVSGIDEVEAIIGRIPVRDPKNGLFFRGQSSLYRLNRPDRVKRLLFADSCAFEPSVPTAAGRHRFDYDSVHFALRHYLQYRHFADQPAGQSEQWEYLLGDSMLKLDYALMALAQHYGIPTHGLDVTTDPAVACWFATHCFDLAANRASYRKLSAADWPSSPKDRPVVLVCQVVTHSLAASLHDCQELEALGLTALRPHRQKARFFLGGHSEHRNRLAEAIVCVLRLGPGDYDRGLSFDHLFPEPAQDPAYEVLLKFADDPLFAPFGADRVNRFHA